MSRYVTNCRDLVIVDIYSIDTVVIISLSMFKLHVTKRSSDEKNMIIFSSTLKFTLAFRGLYRLNVLSLTYTCIIFETELL